MGEHHIEEIPVSSLLLNVENPRFDIVSSQHEAIHRMIEEQDDKLIKLARDIVDAGLNPSDFHLSHGGVTMDEANPLADYDVDNGDTVLLIPASTAG